MTSILEAITLSLLVLPADRWPVEAKDRIAVPVREPPPDQLRIAFLVDKCEPYYVGGYEARVWNLAKRLAGRFEVHVLTSLPVERATVEQVQFHRACTTAFLQGRSGERSLLHSALFAFNRLPRLLAKIRPDVLVVEAIPYVHLPFVKRVARRLGVKTILNVNEAWNDYSYMGGLLATPSSRLIHGLLALGASWADEVVAISSATARSLQTNYDVSNIEVIPMGIDLARIRAAKPTDRRVPEFDFVSVGRLVHIKRHRDMINALALLRREGWQGRATIIGEGPLRPALQNLCVKLGLGRQIQFTGFVSDERKLELLYKSRSFVLPSEREGFSLSCLEALACGLPVILARSPHAEVFGASDIVRDDVSGIHYPVGDLSALERAMRTLLTNEAVRTRLSLRGEEIALDYDWNSISVAFSCLIERVFRAG